MRLYAGVVMFFLAGVLLGLMLYAHLDPSHTVTVLVTKTIHGACVLPTAPQ